MKSMLALALCFIAAGARAQQAPQTFADLGLTITFPATFTEVKTLKVDNKQQLAKWSAKLGPKFVFVWLIEPPYPDLAEPSDITANIVLGMRDNGEHSNPSFHFDECKNITGSFGWAPYASFARCAQQEPGSTSKSSEEFYFCGLTKQRGYMLEVNVQAPPDAAQEQAVLEFFTKGVVYAGEKRDAKWSDEEAKARWNADVPKSDQKTRRLSNTIRTQHYIILSNSSGGPQFAKKMEECYATIKATFPFDEVAEQRLMPVFLFRLPDEYYEFYAKQFSATEEDARKSKGVAYRDFYATWYEAPNDPVHIHEATHQIFGNRMSLHGGGSWFQEGVAEYICTQPNERNDIARVVKNGKHVPLAKFMQIESLLWSANDDDKSGESAAENNYHQAALLIEFLRDSKLGKDKFTPWMRAIGLAPRNDVAAIETITRANYGLDIAGLDKAFVEYCKKR
jgi:hypothetical protein